MKVFSFLNFLLLWSFASSHPLANFPHHMTATSQRGWMLTYTSSDTWSQSLHIFKLMLMQGSGTYSGIKSGDWDGHLIFSVDLYLGSLLCWNLHLWSSRLWDKLTVYLIEFMIPSVFTRAPGPVDQWMGKFNV